MMFISSYVTFTVCYFLFIPHPVGDSESSRRIKTEFLTQMDGVIVHSSDALLIAATNIPWELDEAIRRRFDKCIYIPLPDLEARTYMLKLRIRDLPNDLTGEQLKALGRNTDGASGSGIDALVKDAHLESFNKYFKAKQFLPIENGNYYEPCEFYPNCRFCLPKLSTDPPDKDYTCEKCGANRMRLMDVPSDKLKPPTLTWKYFERALEKRSYTAVSAQEQERFADWTNRYGECGTM
jgi:vacuolar protein-sorting-associated protein 4